MVAAVAGRHPRRAHMRLGVPAALDQIPVADLAAAPAHGPLTSQSAAGYLEVGPMSAASFATRARLPMKRDSD